MAVTSSQKVLPGTIHSNAATFAAALGSGEQAAADQILAAHAKAYARIRVDMDALMQKVQAAKDAGTPLSPAWLYQQEHLKNALNTTKVEIAKYAQYASQIATQQQASAVGAALAHAKKLTTQAVGEAMPGLAASFVHLNPANMEAIVGFLGDGSPLNDLVNTLPIQTAEQVRSALVTGIGLGKGPEWMTRQIDKALDMPRWRAESIMRTESQRAYRHVTRSTFQANHDVLDGWTWVAHLDARTCPCCIGMDGTEHTVDDTLDGHPRCRCVMVPRTKTWDQILGEPSGLPDTRPPVRSGPAWFAQQSSTVQHAILGPGKFKAYKAGQVSLEDMVARTSHPGWGTMRRERSLREIAAGKNANWVDEVHVPEPPKPPPVVQPNQAMALSQNHTNAELVNFLANADPGSQMSLNLRSALQMQQGRLGPFLPEADLAKAEQIAAKLDQAAITKGYPSKGYSQSKAIYKAQANGQVGSKVGVTKSLSWEQKLTAQRALEIHAESLPKALRTLESNTKVVKAAKDAEAKGQFILKMAENGHDYSLGIGSELNASDIALDTLTADGIPTTSTAWKAAKAGNQALDAVDAGYKDAQMSVNALRAEHPGVWTPKPVDPWAPVPEGGPVAGGTITLDGDGLGWGKLHYESGNGFQILNPHQVLERIKDYQPGIVHDPVKVKELVKSMTNATGHLDTNVANALDGMLNTPGIEATYNAQHLANIKEALAQGKATLLPEPEASYVADLLAGLKSDYHSIESLSDMISAEGVSSLGVSNATEAIAQYEAFLAQQAAVTAQATADLAQAASEAAKVAQQAGGHVPFKVADLSKDGGTLGTHGAQPYLDQVTGERWLFKPPKTSADDFLATLDDIASRITAKVGLKTPDTYIVTIGRKRGSIQRMFKSTQAFGHGFNPSTLTAADRLAVQEHHVMDWLLSNHDGHRDQFLRLDSGELVGIDKGQAFKWMGRDKLDWDFHPNASFGAPEPVYNTLWRDFATGGTKDVLDPSQGELAKFIQSVQGLSDDELKAMLRPYAEQAAAQGKLALSTGSFPGLTPATIQANDVEAFLKAVVARKNNLAKDFQRLYDKAAAQRKTNLPDWKPTKPAATRAKRATKGKASWKDAPAPKAPKPPVAPDASAASVFDEWIVDAKARYKVFSNGKDLGTSNNWGRFQKVILEQSQPDLDHLLARSYITQEQYDTALNLFPKAKRVLADAEATHAQALEAYKTAVKVYEKDVVDWREANGIIIQHGDEGLDGALVLRTTKDGATWSYPRFLKASDYSTTELSALKSYTGSGYNTLNPALRGGNATHRSIKAIDKAMAKNPPLETDIVVTRNTYLDWAGIPYGTDPSSLMGKILTDKGFLSTSVNDRGAMDSGQKVRLHLRVSAGTKGAYVSGSPTGQGIISSVGGGEAELLLDRDLDFLVHAVYKNNQGKWIVEAQQVPKGWVKPPGWTGKVSADNYGHTVA